MYEQRMHTHTHTEREKDEERNKKRKKREREGGKDTPGELNILIVYGKRGENRCTLT